MFRKFGIPILAALGLVLGVVVVYLGMRRPPVQPIEFPPPKPPYMHYVAGSGIIEASSLNINIGTAVDGIIERVFVQPGQYCKKGDPLFRIDTRDLSARRNEAESAKYVAQANLTRLMSQPRKEEIPPLEARVKQAQMSLADEYSQYTLFRNVSDKRAISFNDFNQRKYAAAQAKFAFKEAQADLDLLKAGAWIEDIKVASQQLEEAEAGLSVADTLLERATVRAPFDGQVLQANINVGDFARGSREDTIFQDSLMIYGATDFYHVRIDIDEDDAWRVFPGACAMGYVRGNSSIQFPLEFVRVDPYVIPKRALTGENLERVDTRVLQLIYRLDKKNLPIYVGQLLDIFVEAKPSQGL